MSPMPWTADISARTSSTATCAMTSRVRCSSKRGRPVALSDGVRPADGEVSRTDPGLSLPGGGLHRPDQPLGRPDPASAGGDPDEPARQLAAGRGARDDADVAQGPALGGTGRTGRLDPPMPRPLRRSRDSVYLSAARPSGTATQRSAHYTASRKRAARFMSASCRCSATTFPGTRHRMLMLRNVLRSYLYDRGKPRALESMACRDRQRPFASLLPWCRTLSTPRYCGRGTSTWFPGDTGPAWL